jgi:hypothetical protein
LFDLTTVTYSSSQIESKRKQIAQLFMEKSKNVNSSSITRISHNDAELLFDLYNEIFFYGQFTSGYQGKLEFSFSERFTRSAGKTYCRISKSKSKLGETTIEIRMGTDFFFRFNETEGDKIVCGILASSGLEAFQLVFEHEMVHALEFIYFGNSSCGRKRFKTIAKDIFGHSSSYHQLPTRRTTVQKSLGYKIGDIIVFFFKNKEYRGILYNINKRATVMVRDTAGAFIDQQGNRYTKYYVPLNLLKRMQ